MSESINLKALLLEFERRIILTALAQNQGNQRRAAAALGVLPTTLHEKMKRLGLKHMPPSTRSLAEAS